MFQTTNQMSLGSYKHSSQNPCWTGCTVSAKIAIMMRPIWTVHHHAALDQMFDPQKRLTTRPGVTCFLALSRPANVLCKIDMILVPIDIAHRGP